MSSLGRIIKIISITAVLCNYARATTYATFYSDSKCTKDATIDFSTTNPGCISVGDREYVSYHGAGPCFGLVKSPSPDCPCQFDCLNGGVSPGTKYVGDCLPVQNPPSGCIHVGKTESLRFIGGHCANNNCPDTSKRNGQSLTTPEDETVSNNQLISRDYGRPGVGYFRMCKDEYCTKDCSINFRTSNPGCFAGDGFKSVEFEQGGTGVSLDLVGTPGASCTCQSSSQTMDGTRSCINLNPSMQNLGSYRMVSSTGGNNC